MNMELDPSGMPDSIIVCNFTFNPFDQKLIAASIEAGLIKFAIVHIKTTEEHPYEFAVMGLGTSSVITIDDFHYNSSRIYNAVTTDDYVSGTRVIELKMVESNANT